MGVVACGKISGLEWAARPDGPTRLSPISPRRILHSAGQIVLMKSDGSGVQTFFLSRPAETFEKSMKKHSGVHNNTTDMC